jgi:hypothetical protein
MTELDKLIYASAALIWLLMFFQYAAYLTDQDVYHDALYCGGVSAVVVTYIMVKIVWLKYSYSSHLNSRSLLGQFKNTPTDKKRDSATVKQTGPGTDSKLSVPGRSTASSAAKQLAARVEQSVI